MPLFSSALNRAGVQARRLTLLTVCVLSSLWAPVAQAGLFEDDEARRAILELRQRLDQSQSQLKEQSEGSDQMRRSLLDLNTQLDLLRKELAQLRGQNEQLMREVSELQRKQRDVQAGVEERMRRLEPQKVVLDGKEFLADPEEKRLFDEALETLRRGDFAAAASGMNNLLRRFPSTGYQVPAQFWLGNAHYGQRQYKEAVTAFREVLRLDPKGSNAPEAMLSLANCQAELKDIKAARRTLDDLIKAFPRSEAAAAAKDRLSGLK